MRNKIKTNKSKTKKKIRKKRTTIKEAFKSGYIAGHNVCESELATYTLEIIDKMIEKYNDDIQRYPRNTKFVELLLDEVMDLRERLIYSEEYERVNADSNIKECREKSKIQSK